MRQLDVAIRVTVGRGGGLSGEQARILPMHLSKLAFLLCDNKSAIVHRGASQATPSYANSVDIDQPSALGCHNVETCLHVHSYKAQAI